MDWIRVEDTSWRGEGVDENGRPQTVHVINDAGEGGGGGVGEGEGDLSQSKVRVAR